MAIDFKKFNQQFPADKMKADMKEAKENGVFPRLAGCVYRLTASFKQCRCGVRKRASSTARSAVTFLRRTPSTRQ